MHWIYIPEDHQATRSGGSSGRLFHSYLYILKVLLCKVGKSRVLVPLSESLHFLAWLVLIKSGFSTFFSSPFQDIRAEAYEFIDNLVSTLNDVSDVLNQPEVWNIEGGPNDFFHSVDLNQNDNLSIRCAIALSKRRITPFSLHSLINWNKSSGRTGLKLEKAVDGGEPLSFF